jgi:hypothetical protein
MTIRRQNLPPLDKMALDRLCRRHTTKIITVVENSGVGRQLWRSDGSGPSPANGATTSAHRNLRRWMAGHAALVVLEAEVAAQSPRI